MTLTRTKRSTAHWQARPHLESLEKRELLAAPVDQADLLIGATATRSAYGVDGAGLTAAIIDTGVNYNHEALGGGFGTGRKVEAGYDFADHDADPMATWQHGTAVTGLLASADPAHPGVAPGADIVALKVFGSNNNLGSFDRIADALQWVVDHHDEYHISVVNLSISDGNNYALDVFTWDVGIGQRMTGLVHKLASLNIPVVTASGNSFDGHTQGMGFIAILPETVSVTATDSSDRLLSIAQRLGKDYGGTSATDLAAPGSGLTAPADGNTFSTVEGTSFAAPIVSGAIVLFQQIYQSRFGHLPSVDALNSWLKQGADSISDPVTGITLGRLDIAKSAALIPAAPVQPPPAPTPPHQTQIYIDGHLVNSAVAGNPFDDFLAEFGLSGAFDQVQVWSPTGQTTISGSTPSNANPFERILIWNSLASNPPAANATSKVSNPASSNRLGTKRHVNAQHVISTHHVARPWGFARRVRNR